MVLFFQLWEETKIWTAIAACWFVGMFALFTRCLGTVDTPTHTSPSTQLVIVEAVLVLGIV